MDGQFYIYVKLKNRTMLKIAILLMHGFVSKHAWVSTQKHRIGSRQNKSRPDEYKATRYVEHNSPGLT